MVQLALYAVILVAGFGYLLRVNEFLTGKLPVFDQLAIMILAGCGIVYVATKIAAFAVWARRQTGDRNEQPPNEDDPR